MLAYIKSISNKSMALVASVALAVIFLSSIIFMRVGSGSMSVLYSGLDIAEQNEITHLLDQWGREYSVEGGDVFVDTLELREIRMMLATEGLPSTGSIVGYEIFNKSESFGTSGFIQNVNLVRALEGELGRTIMSFEKIRKARVHLVIPKKEIFSQNRPVPSASVVLKMGSRSATLPKKEIDAIAYLVSSAVPGLTVDNVTIVTTEGTALRLSGDDGGFSTSLQEYKFETERRIRESVEHLVEKTIGVGKVRAEVTAEVDLDQLVVDTETYDPDGQVKRSSQVVEEREESKEGSEANVSVGNNVPNGSQGTQSESARARKKEKTEETINYEISKEKRKQVKTVGEIKRLSLAVLVDGEYVFNEQNGQKTYTPVSDETIEKLKKLLSSAVGLQKSRGDVLDVVNMQFYPEAPEAPEQWWENEMIYELLRLVVLSLITLIIVFFMIKPLLNRVLDVFHPQPKVDPEHLAAEQQDAAVAAAAAEAKVMNEAIDLDALNNLVAGNPDVAVEMLRSWISSNANDEGGGR